MKKVHEMFTRKEAYDQADVVDAVIQKVIAEHPFTENTHMGWLTFVRTIRTSVDMVEAAVLKSMRLSERNQSG
jgi:hypothetical protein